MWEEDEIHSLNNCTLNKLLQNKIPAIRIQGFASPSEINAFKDALLIYARKTSSVKQVTRLGISQYQQGVLESKDHYFNLAKEVSNEFAAVYAESFNPLTRFIDLLSQYFPDVGIMHEEGYGDYFAGVGKLRNGLSPIHVDFAPQDSQGWAIGETIHQLAWNFYLDIPSHGGEHLLWEKEWKREDDKYMADGNYYYSSEVVEGARLLTVPVQTGEIVLINSRNFHAIAEANDRLAYGSFISYLNGNKLRLWS